MFYRLFHSGLRKYKYAYRDLSISGIRKVECATCGRLLSELCYSDNGHVLAIEGGKEFPDYLGFYDAGPRLCVLSKRAVEVFSANNISGISAFELVSFANANETINYYIAEIYGRIDLDLKSMQLKKKHLCHSCGQFEWNRQRLTPVIVSPQSWDGSDFCRISSIEGYVVCSEKVVRLVKENRLTGFEFQELKEGK